MSLSLFAFFKNGFRCYGNRYRPAGKNSSLQHSPRREEEKVKDSVPSDKIALSTIVSVDYEATEISSGARLRPSLHEQEKDDDDDVPRYIPGSPSEVSLRKARTTRGSEEGPLPSGQVEMEMAASSKVNLCFTCVSPAII